MKKLNHLGLIAIALTVGLGIQACTQSSPTATQTSEQLQGKLVLIGSNTIAPLAAEIGKRFESEHPDVRVDVVIVTHNLAQARRIGDYAALFWVRAEVGRLIEYGTVEQIFTPPQHDLTAAYINGIRG